MKRVFMRVEFSTLSHKQGIHSQHFECEWIPFMGENVTCITIPLQHNGCSILCLYFWYDMDFLPIYAFMTTTTMCLCSQHIINCRSHLLWSFCCTMFKQLFLVWHPFTLKYTLYMALLKYTLNRCWGRYLLRAANSVNLISTKMVVISLSQIYNIMIKCILKAGHTEILWISMFE